MKNLHLGLNKISQYYRLSGYVTSLERVARKRAGTIYPYLPNELAINHQEALKLCSINQKQNKNLDKIEPINPIQEEDCYA